MAAGMQRQQAQRGGLSREPGVSIGKLDQCRQSARGAFDATLQAREAAKDRAKRAAATYRIGEARLERTLRRSGIGRPRPFGGNTMAGGTVGDLLSGSMNAVGKTVAKAAVAKGIVLLLRG